MPYHMSYHVAPRYTSGSPALVPQEIAERVAREEKDAYEAYMRFPYVPEMTQRAKEKGLDGIAYATWEQNNVLHTVDLITDKHSIRNLANYRKSTIHKPRIPVAMRRDLQVLIRRWEDITSTNNNADFADGIEIGYQRAAQELANLLQEYSQ